MKSTTLKRDLFCRCKVILNSCETVMQIGFSAQYNELAYMRGHLTESNMKDLERLAVMAENRIMNKSNVLIDRKS